MNLHRLILTENDCYKAGRTIVPQGVMVHSTGANNPNLRRYVGPDDGLLGVNPNNNHWNRSGIDACVHAFIGKLSDGSVAAYQTLPWDHRGWHAGKGTTGKSANDTHISFEICEDGLDDRDYFEAVYREAVELTAHLCGLYGLEALADGVVICHSEGYRRGIASGHADVEHWFPRFGRSMDDFRADVAAEMNKESEEDGMVYYETMDDVPEWYREAVRKCVDAGALGGVGGGRLHISEDMCRTLTVLDRLGKL